MSNNVSFTIIKEGIGQPLSSEPPTKELFVNILVEFMDTKETLTFTRLRIRENMLNSHLETQIMLMKQEEIREIVYESPDKQEKKIVRVNLLEICSSKEKLENPWDIDDDRERLLFSQNLKAKGNDLLKKGVYKEANTCYSLGLDLVASDTGASFKENKNFLSSNLILGLIREGSFQKAKEIAEEVLKEEPNIVKIRFRKALAEISLGEFENAREDLVKAKELEPDNQEIIKELAGLKEKEKSMKEKAKAIYSKMFGSGK